MAMERRDQDKALKDWELLKTHVKALDPFIVAVLLRGTYDSGMRSFHLDDDDPEFESSKTSYADSTGDTAVADLYMDAVTKRVEGIASHISAALSRAQKVLAVGVEDVPEVVKMCSACGDPIRGRVRLGRWDEKCFSRFRRWVDAGNPPDEKVRFESYVQASIVESDA